MIQPSLFERPVVNGRITGRPVPQDKADLYPLLTEPDHEASFHSYWRYTRERKSGWEFLIVRYIGFGSFNGLDLMYCELPGGEKNEFGMFSLFPATQQEILQFWGADALAGYRKRLAYSNKKVSTGLIKATRG